MQPSTRMGDALPGGARGNAKRIGGGAVTAASAASTAGYGPSGHVAAPAGVLGGVAPYSRAQLPPSGVDYGAATDPYATGAATAPGQTDQYGRGGGGGAFGGDYAFGATGGAATGGLKGDFFGGSGTAAGGRQNAAPQPHAHQHHQQQQHPQHPQQHAPSHQHHPGMPQPIFGLALEPSTTPQFGGISSQGQLAQPYGRIAPQQQMRPVQDQPDPGSTYNQQHGQGQQHHQQGHHQQQSHGHADQRTAFGTLPPAHGIAARPRFVGDVHGMPNQQQQLPPQQQQLPPQQQQGAVGQPGQLGQPQYMGAPVDGSSQVQKTFACQICSQTFGDSGSLQRHTARAHRAQGQKGPVICEQCNASLKNEQNLKRHIAVCHTGDQDFTCTACSATFSSRGSLRNHQQSVHRVPTKGAKRAAAAAAAAAAAGESVDARPPRAKAKIAKTSDKSWACDMCSDTFKWKGNLKRHRELRHLHLRPFTCNICRASFGTKSNMRVHLITHDKEAFNQSNGPSAASGGAPPAIGGVPGVAGVPGVGGVGGAL